MWERIEKLNIKLNDSRIIDWIAINGEIWVKLQEKGDK